MSNRSLDRYITVTEAAERLRINRATVHKWIRDGYLDAVRLGPSAKKQRVYVLADSIEQRLAEAGVEA